MIYNTGTKLEKVTEPNGKIIIFESGKETNALTEEEKEKILKIEQEVPKKFVVFYSKKYQKKLILMYSKTPEINDDDIRCSRGLEIELTYDENEKIKSYSSRGVFVVNEGTGSFSFDLNPKAIDLFGSKILSKETLEKIQTGKISFPKIASFHKIEMILQEGKTQKINTRTYYFLDLKNVPVNEETNSFVQDVYPDDPLGIKIIDPISKNEDYAQIKKSSMNN